MGDSDSLTPREATVRDARHTPGPWDFQPSVPAAGYECFWIGPNNASICIATVDGPQSSQFRWANACLIAAAPTMLDRLESTLNTLALMADAYPLGSATRNTLEDECAAIRETLAKATQPPAPRGEANPNPRA